MVFLTGSSISARTLFQIPLFGVVLAKQMHTFDVITHFSKLCFFQVVFKHSIMYIAPPSHCSLCP